MEGEQVDDDELVQIARTWSEFLGHTVTPAEAAIMLTQWVNRVRRNRGLAA